MGALQGRAVTIPRGFAPGPCPGTLPRPHQPPEGQHTHILLTLGQAPDSRSTTATAQRDPPQLSSTPASGSHSVSCPKARRGVDTWFKAKHCGHFLEDSVSPLVK